MATTFSASPPRTKPIGADGYERVLSYGSGLLFAATITAIWRGRAEWALIPSLIWLHLATILFATALTPVILLGRRGTRRHRLLGRVWAAALIGTALPSFGIRVIQPGRLSWIHLLSLFTLLMVPRLWWTARRHQVTRHRSAVKGLVTGALLIAGFFTFPFGRLLGHWLFG